MFNNKTILKSQLIRTIIIDIRTEDFINIYRKCTAEPYSVFVNDTALASNNPLSFRKYLFGIYNKNHDN